MRSETRQKWSIAGQPPEGHERASYYPNDYPNDYPNTDPRTFRTTEPMPVAGRIRRVGSDRAGRWEVLK